MYKQKALDLKRRSFNLGGIMKYQDTELLIRVWDNRHYKAQLSLSGRVSIRVVAFAAVKLNLVLICQPDSCVTLDANAVKFDKDLCFATILKNSSDLQVNISNFVALKCFVHFTSLLHKSSRLQLRGCGICFPGGSYQITTKCYHVGASSCSSVRWRQVLYPQGQASLMAVSNNYAKHSELKQNLKALALDPSSVKVILHPELNLYHPCKQAKHGACFVRIPLHLAAYLQARGIENLQATNLLGSCFLKESGIKHVPQMVFKGVV